MMFPKEFQNAATVGIGTWILTQLEDAQAQHVFYRDRPKKVRQLNLEGASALRAVRDDNIG
jgi:hypothetical protein